MINDRVVIGVIGSSRKPESAGLELAEGIGKLITDHQHILLTGGRLRGDKELTDNVLLTGEGMSQLNNEELKRTNDTAMKHAIDQGIKNKPGRLISIHRDHKHKPSRSNNPHWSADQPIDSYRLITLFTKLKDARNYINGYVPDVLIAIGGGAGTLTELASALANNTPIVLLDDGDKQVQTLQWLKTVSNNDEKTVEFKRYMTMIRKEFNPQHALFQGQPDPVPVLNQLHKAAVIEKTTKAAIAKAISLAKPNKRNLLPHHPQLDQLRDDFHVLLERQSV